MVIPRITPTTVKAAGRPAVIELVIAVVIAEKSAATIILFSLRNWPYLAFFVESMDETISSIQVQPR